MKLSFVIFLVLTFEFQISVCQDFCHIQTDNQDLLLKQHLFCDDYSAMVRPVKDHATKTVVNVHMIVKSFDFDDEDSKMVINSWLITSWMDEYLVWEPAQHDNIVSIDIAGTIFWRPEISLYNEGLFLGKTSCIPMECTITFNGKVSCIDPCTHVSTCEADYTYWPFDHHNCSLSFGSWVQQGEEVDFNPEKLTVKTTKVQRNGNWRLTSAVAGKEVLILFHKLKGVISIPRISFDFSVERIPGSEKAYVFCPAIIFIIANVFILLMNPRLGDRFLVIGINIICHFLFMIQLILYVPFNAENTPLIYIFYKDSLLLTTILLIETILVSKFSFYEFTSPSFINGFIQKVIAIRIPSPMVGSEVKSEKFNNNNNNNEGDESKIFDKDPFEELREDQQVEVVVINDSETNEKEKSSKISTEKLENWKIYGKFFDRTFVIFLLILYAIMIYGLFPKEVTPESSVWLKVEEIVSNTTEKST